NQRAQADRQTEHDQARQDHAEQREQPLLARLQACEAIAQVHGVSSAGFSSGFGFFLAAPSSGHLASNSSTYFWRSPLTTCVTFTTLASCTQRFSPTLLAIACASAVVPTMPLSLT